MAGEQELKIKNKNKVQKIIFIVNVMRIINPYTHILAKAYHQFSNKRGPYRLYISVS